MGSVNSRTFSRVTIKRARIQVMMEINEKCDKESQFFLVIANYVLFFYFSMTFEQ